MTPTGRPDTTDNAPRCEVCRREPATSLSWFADRKRWYADRSGTWRFTGNCTADCEAYYVMLRHRGHGFLDSAESREHWLLHLAEKTWFNYRDFAAMLERFIAAGGPAFVRRPKGGHPGRLRMNAKPAVSKDRELPRLEPSPALPTESAT